MTAVCYIQAEDTAVPVVEFSANPGTYHDDIELAIIKSPPGIRVFYSFDPGEAPPLLPFPRALKLSAVEGEERDYQILIFLYQDSEPVGEQLLEYVISKKRPAPPGIDISPGLYNKDLDVRFKQGDARSIFYALDTEISDSETFWDGRAVRLTAADGEVRTRRLQVYAVDHAGNRSRIAGYDFIIDKTAEALAGSSLAVSSPASGTYANKQHLVIQGRNLTWIKYTLDGTDPLASGRFYTAPLLIESTGEIIVKVAARPHWTDSEVLTSETIFTVTPESTGNQMSIDNGSGIYKNDLTVRLNLNINSRFLYTLDGSTPGLDDTLTLGDISLKGRDNEINTFDLRVSALKPNGSLSPVYRYCYIIDKRQLQDPSFFVYARAPYTRDVKVRVTATPGSTVYYTVDGSRPDNSSPEAVSLITVNQADADSSGLLLLRAVAYDQDGNRSGLVVHPFEFTAGESTGESGSLEIMEPATVSSRVELPVAEGETIVYEITSDGSLPPDPGVNSPAAISDIGIDVPPGMEREFRIKTGKIVNNQVVSVKLYTYVIDRQPPLNPSISDITIDGVFSGPVTFSLAAGAGKIYYQVTEDGSEPDLAADRSPSYSSPVVLQGREDEDITFRINAMAVDAYNNTSTMINPARFRIDKKPPPVPGEPEMEIYGYAVEQKYRLSWNLEEGTRLFYRFSRGINYSDTFLAYTSPLFIDFAQEERGIHLEAYQQDLAGNKSRVITFALDPAGQESEPPVVMGVEDGGAYNSSVTIKFLSPGGDVHYELTSDGSRPPAVQLSSPAATGELTLDAAEGQVLNYRLRARAFDSQIWNITSGEISMAFTIDKQPPDPPVVKGITDGGIYYTHQLLEFEAADASIYYSLVSDRETGTRSLPGDFALYHSPVSINGESGQGGAFRLKAFTMDKAGNISRTLSSWKFCLDINALYVSNTGNDLSEGTRDRPLQTLVKALEYAGQTGRSVVYLATGRYIIDRTLTLDNNLELRGGYDPASWQREGALTRSTIRAITPLRRGTPYFDIRGGSVIFSGINLDDPSGSCSVLVRQQGGRLTFQTSRLETGAIADARAVSTSGTILKVADCRLDAAGTSTGILVDASGGEISITDTSFSGPREADIFTALAVTDSRQVKLDGLILDPGKGRKITGAVFNRCNIKVYESKIASGSGAVNAVAVNLRSSTMELDKTIINGNTDAGFVIGILVAEGNLHMQDSVINANSSRGATGIKASASTLFLNRSQVRGSANSEFLYLVNLTGGKADFFNSLFLGASSEDAVCVLLDSADSRWINNTIVGGSGNALTDCFLIKGSYLSDFINNIIAREGPPRGNAIHLLGNTEIHFQVKNNNFTGWERLLKLDYISDTGRNLGFYNPGKYNKINTVELLDNLDGNAPGGNIHQNISENFYKTFSGSRSFDHHLAGISACVNAGLAVAALGYPELNSDIDGDTRPAADAGSKPACDIGADEYVKP